MKITQGFVNPIQITTTAQGAQGKVTLPVSRSDSLYAQYKYVKGIPAGSHQGSVPLKKLEVINNMINTLQHLREINSHGREMLSQSQEIQEIPKTHSSSGSLDVMIENLGRQLHTELTRQTPAFTTPVNTQAAAGMNFILSA